MAATTSDGPFVLYFLLTLFYGMVNSLTSPIFPDLKVHVSAQASPRAPASDCAADDRSNRLPS